MCCRSWFHVVEVYQLFHTQQHNLRAMSSSLQNKATRQLMLRYIHTVIHLASHWQCLSMFRCVLKHFLWYVFQEVAIENNQVHFSSGFLNPTSVPILFEETFYNEKEQAYSILCVTRPIDCESSPGKKKQKQPNNNLSLHAIYIQSISTCLVSIHVITAWYSNNHINQKQITQFDWFLIFIFIYRHKLYFWRYWRIYTEAHLFCSEYFTAYWDIT